MNKFFLVFFATAVTDVVWALYIRQTSHGNALKSAIWAALIILFGAFTVVSYVNNTRMLIPAALGAFFGTFATVWWNNRKKPVDKVAKEE